MAKAQTGTSNSHLQFCHILIWLLFFLLSLRYFTIASPGIIAWLLTCITTVFAALSFYVSVLFLAHLITRERKRLLFIASVILFLACVSLCRSILELAVYRLFVNDLKDIYFMGMFWSSLFLTGFISLLGITVRLAGNSYREKEKMNSILNEKLTAELVYLKNQVHPHFLFNIHNTIFFLINENPGLASKMLLKLSDIMRYQLYECEAVAVSLEKELLNISNYTDLEKVRLGSKVDIAINFTENMQGMAIAPFMLMPFVENAVKHISHFTDKPNYIRIIVEAGRTHLTFTVINTYEYNENELTNKEFPKGIGLQNLQRRLNLVYENKSWMNITTENNLFTANLRLQLL
jgi:two-component system, LytTR family, sensor kinase